MIPERDEIHTVILTLLRDGATHSSDEIRAHVADHFHLTDEERNRRRGPHREHANETAWVLVTLQRHGHIKKVDPRHRRYRITDSGRHHTD